MIGPNHCNISEKYDSRGLMDHGFTIEEIHEMIDAVEISINRLRSSNLHSKKMRVAFISEGVSVIYDLDGAGVLGSTGINNSLARKLKNLDDFLPANVMLAALGRVRSYLRRIESEFGGTTAITEEDERLIELDTVVERNPPAPVAVWSEKWVYVRTGSKAKQLIAELSDVLDEVALLVKSTNLPEEDAALTDLERAQLIALLETALHMLRAPMVEPGLLKKARQKAVEAADKATQKGVEQVMGRALEGVGKRILELLSWLG